jgi:hypothetical protein
MEFIEGIAIIELLVFCLHTLAILCLYIARRPLQNSFNQAKTIGVARLVKIVLILNHINMYRMNGKGL